MEWVKSLMEKTARSGVWLFRGAFSGNSAFFALAAFARWVKKGIVPYSLGGHPTVFVFFVHTCMGEARLSGHTSGRAMLAIA